MPSYVFLCKKCNFIFEELCNFSEIKNVVCLKCNGKEVDQQVTLPKILGPTSSKLDNFEYRAGYNMDKAQNESRKAKEEASKKGISGYRDIDDISSGNNFDPSKW